MERSAHQARHRFVASARRGREVREPPSRWRSDAGARDSLTRSRYAGGMSGIRARVENGRLLVDETTASPEGTEVDLVVHDEGDSLDATDRAVLDAEIAAGWRSVEAPRSPRLRRTCGPPRPVTRQGIVAPEAEREVRQIDSWWRAHRAASTDLFAGEPAAELATIEAAPEAVTQHNHLHSGPTCHP